MAKNVEVKWGKKSTTIGGVVAPDHYVVTLGLTEAHVPYAARSHVFPNVAPGDWSVVVQLVGADGTELGAPAIDRVVVPEDINADLPETLTFTLS